jgi:hypothetical protein
VDRDRAVAGDGGRERLVRALAAEEMRLDPDRYGPRYYDIHGRPISLMQWSHAMAQYRHVGESVLRIRGRWFRVSTVWLGLDHSFFGGRPLIFETMIFTEGGMGYPGSDMYQVRYSTITEAQRGHMRAVRWVKRNVREARSPQLIYKGRKPIGRRSTNCRRRK